MSTAEIQTPQVETALRIVDQFWSRHLFPDELFTSDAAFALQGRAVDRSELTRLTGHALAAALPDASVRVRSTLQGDDIVAVRATTTGTHAGRLFGVPATGCTVSFNCVGWFAFGGDRVCRLDIHWNSFAPVRPLWEAYDRLTRSADAGRAAG